MTKDKRDLEDEMSRFEMEIAGQLPPPPKPPNLTTPSVSDVHPMTPFTTAAPPKASPSPAIPSIMLRPPSFPGISPPNFMHSSSSGLPPYRPPMPVASVGVPSRPAHSMTPMFMPTQPPLSSGPMPMMSMPNMSAGPMSMPPVRPASYAHPSMPMHTPAPAMPPGMSMMSSPASYQMPFHIQPPTVPLDDFRPGPSSAGVMMMNTVPVVETPPEVSNKKKKEDKKKKIVRVGGGQVWEDDSLTDWDTNDFRIFCGDLGNEVTDDQLYRAFSKYPSLLKAKVIRDKRSQKTKGYGFVSFKNPQEYLRAMREMNGKYLGNRPIKLRKSTWKDRNIEIVKKKDREKKKLGLR